MKNDGAQMLLLTGFVMAILIISFAIIINAAVHAGQNRLEHGVDDAHYIFKNVRDVYGDILRQASDNGYRNPFPYVTPAELNMTRILSERGYSLTLLHQYVDLHAYPPNAVALIIFSDGDTVYRDEVMYDLFTGGIIVRRPLLQFVVDSELIKEQTVSFNITNVAPHNVTIGRMTVSWHPVGGELEEIYIDTVEVWDNGVYSGTTVDIEPDTTIYPGQTVTVVLYFEDYITGKNFTVEFIYPDHLSDSIRFRTW